MNKKNQSGLERAVIIEMNADEVRIANTIINTIVDRDVLGRENERKNSGLTFGAEYRFGHDSENNIGLLFKNGQPILESNSSEQIVGTRVRVYLEKSRESPLASTSYKGFRMGPTEN